MLGRWNQSYNPLPTDGLDAKEHLGPEGLLNGNHAERPPSKQTRLTVPTIIAIAVLTTCTIAIIMIVSHFSHHKHPRYITKISSVTKTNDRPHLCGKSSAEALTLGCSFDQLTWSWLPPECPHYANDEFVNDTTGPWIYYPDPYSMKPITEEQWAQVLDGELMVFGQRREHVTHCIFNFLSIAQIVRDGSTKYTEKLVEYEHIHHCAMMLLDIVRKEEGWDRVQTIVGTVSFDESC